MLRLWNCRCVYGCGKCGRYRTEIADIILLQRTLKLSLTDWEWKSLLLQIVSALSMLIHSGHFYAIAIDPCLSHLPMLPIQILPKYSFRFSHISSLPTRLMKRTCKPRKYEVGDHADCTLPGGGDGIWSMFLHFSARGDTVLQTNWFVGSILTELISSQLEPNYHFIRRHGLPGMFILTLVAALATVLLPYTFIERHYSTSIRHRLSIWASFSVWLQHFLYVVNW